MLWSTNGKDCESCSFLQLNSLRPCIYRKLQENQSVTSLRDIRIKVRNRFNIEMDIGGGKIRCDRLTNDQIVVSCRTI
jgi:hypothetical protein